MNRLPESPPPLALTRHTLAAVVVLLLWPICVGWCDLPVARWFQETQLPGDLRRLVTVAEVFAYGGGVLGIILTAVVLDRRGWRVGVFLAVYSLGAGIAADVIKLTIARLRPYDADLTKTAIETWGPWFPLAQPPENYGAGWQSFPSAHTATAFGLATALTLCYPRGRWLFFTFAVLAGVQRMNDDAHFLSDVLAGAAVGLWWSLALERSGRISALRGEPQNASLTSTTSAS